MCVVTKDGATETGEWGSRGVVGIGGMKGGVGYGIYGSIHTGIRGKVHKDMQQEGNTGTLQRDQHYKNSNHGTLRHG